MSICSRRSASRDRVLAYAAGLSDDDLVRQTRPYGRDVPRWAVLAQLVSHMNEHLGQSIACARMNGAVPPVVALSCR